MKTLEGVVWDVIIERSDPGKKQATKIVANYDLGGGVIKRASIVIRSIKAKEVPNVVVEAPGQNVQNVQDAVGGIQAPEEQREPEQPRPVGMSPEQYRWLLVDEFVSYFNDYCAKTFTPSDLICIDESNSRWY
jgi:hypothetical protein